MEGGREGGRDRGREGGREGGRRINICDVRSILSYQSVPVDA